MWSSAFLPGRATFPQLVCHKTDKMDAPSIDETRELLIGTWIAMAMIVEILVEQELVSREELLLLLSRAETAACDRRSTAIAGLRLLIERGFS